MNARPPRSWELRTVAVMVVIATTAVFGMLLLATQLVVRAYLASDGASEVSPLVSAIIRNSDMFDLLYLLLGVAYIVAFLWWRHNTRELLRKVGDEAGSATRHWAIPVWTAALVASVLLRQAADPYAADGPAAELGLDALRTAIRVAGIGVLLLGVWQIRQQVRRTVAESGVVLRVTDLGPRATANPLPPPAPASDVSMASLPRADENFWDAVRRRAAVADLVMLETTEGPVRRWTLLPRGGDLASIRATVPPGAIVTVFAEPPTAAGTEDFTPVEASGYHGFLEDAESGALWYQPVPPRRVPAFLARTRSARRWALYPVESATALTAVTAATS